MIWNLQMPQLFKSKIEGNFCAMKYVNSLSDYDRLLLVERARAITDEDEAKELVDKLADLSFEKY